MRLRSVEPGKIAANEIEFSRGEAAVLDGFDVGFEMLRLEHGWYDDRDACTAENAVQHQFWKQRLIARIKLFAQRLR